MYTFKLQAVLDHRQFVEDNLNKELAQIRQQIMTARKHLDRLKRKEMHTFAELKERQADGLSSDQVVAYHAYFKRLCERIAGQKTAVDEIREKESEKQEELLEAMKRRQILEKLKEQGLERYNRVLVKKEMAFIDEIAVNRFARKTFEKCGEGE